MLPKTIINSVEAFRALKQCAKNALKAYFVERAMFSILHPYRSIEINDDVADIAKQTPFSYFDILPLYEDLNNDKARTLRAVDFCMSNNLPLAVMRRMA
jgi:hypothetical protein